MRPVAASVRVSCLLAATALAAAPTSGRTAHPFVTDDTGTQGAGDWQLEVSGEHHRDGRAAGPVQQRNRLNRLNPVLTYGVLENVDVALGLNYLRYSVTQNGAVSAEADGASDTTLELKWRFYSENGFSLAVKPGLQLPTGDENRGLGTGRMSWGVNFIGAYEAERWAWMANVFYYRQRFGLPQDAAANRTQQWMVSSGATYAVVGGLKLAGELGVRTNSARNDPFFPGSHGAFAMAGVIYSPTDRIDLDAGVRQRLNHAENDTAFLVGATIRW